MLNDETNIVTTALVNTCTELAIIKAQKLYDDRKITALDTQKAALDCEKASLGHREFKVIFLSLRESQPSWTDNTICNRFLEVKECVALLPRED